MVYTEEDVPQEVKSEIKAKITDCIKTAQLRFNRIFYMPTLEYNIHGRVAATAFSSSNLIRINPTLLLQNREDFVAQTIPHEFAHIVADTVYPNGHVDTTKRVKRIPHHGTGWRAVMELFGIPPKIYHNYDTPPQSSVVRYPHTCSICNTVIQLTAAQSTALRKFPHYMSHTKCGNQSVLTANDPTQLPLSKLHKCEQLYLANRTAPRVDLIKQFVEHAGTTPASSATYYATLRKKYDR